VISSSDEVIFPDRQPRAEQIPDIDSYTPGALIRDLGARVHHYGIIPDSLDDLEDPGVFVPGLQIRPGKPAILALAGRIGCRRG